MRPDIPTPLTNSGARALRACGDETSYPCNNGHWDSYHELRRRRSARARGVQIARARRALPAPAIEETDLDRSLARGDRLDVLCRDPALSDRYT